MNQQIQSEWLKNLIERIILFPVQVRHRRAARAKHKTRIATLATVRRTLQGATQVNAESTRTVFNVGLYVLLLDQDIGFFTNDLICAIGDRRRTFVAKHEALLLYEAAEDLPQLLGRDFREAVKRLGASTEQIGQLNSVSSDLNQFWQNHREFLGEIRNALAAHREHDALGYVEALDALKPLDVMRRAAALSQLLDRLIGTITELAQLTVGHAAILRDIVVSGNAKSK